MSTNNPYASPSKETFSHVDPAAGVRAPATALIVVTIIWLVLILLSLLFSAFLLASGVAADMSRTGGMSSESTIVMRMIFSVCILGVNAVILMGAIKMRAMENYSLAKAAAIMAVIPCITPCYLFGIPFGVWALMALLKPGVREAFK